MSIRRRGFLKSAAALLAVPGMPAIGFAGTCTDDATLLNLGLKKQLFFDDLLIESVHDPVTVKIPSRSAATLADETRRVNQALALANRALNVVNASTNIRKSLIGVAGIYDTLGWAQYLTGESKWDDALANLKHSKDLDPQPSTYFHLVKVYQAKGLSNDALYYVEEGIKVATAKKDPTLADLQSLKQEIR